MKLEKLASLDSIKETVHYKGVKLYLEGFGKLMRAINRRVTGWMGNLEDPLVASKE